MAYRAIDGLSGGSRTIRKRDRYGDMGKTWILDTSTKGTGASMVPLDNVLRKPSEQAEPLFVPPPPAPKAAPAPEPRRPRLFKVVDIVTRQVLIEDAHARAVTEVLSGVRSIVDVNVYVWQPKTEKWRLLTFEERRLLWESRASAERSSKTGA
jgi:hypothetical protein